MTDKTPLEKIEEMYDMLQSLQQQIEVIDANLKLLNSKANGELFQSVKQFNPASQPQIKTSVAQDLDSAPTIGVPMPEKAPQQEVGPSIEATKRKTTIVQGKILHEDGRPVPGVNVKIISPTNKQVITETKTNNAGLWTKFLGPGKYIVKYVHDTRPTQFRMIDVPKGKDKMMVK